MRSNPGGKINCVGRMISTSKLGSCVASLSCVNYFFRVHCMPKVRIPYAVRRRFGRLAALFPIFREQLSSRSGPSR